MQFLHLRDKKIKKRGKLTQDYNLHYPGIPDVT